MTVTKEPGSEVARVYLSCGALLEVHRDFAVLKFGGRILLSQRRENWGQGAWRLNPTGRKWSAMWQMPPIAGEPIERTQPKGRR